MIFIIEPDATGHRLVYVRLLVEGALQRGLSVVLLLGSSAQHSVELQVHLAAYVNHEKVIWRYGCSMRDVLECMSSVGSPSQIVIPHLDRLLRKGLGLAVLARVTKVSGLVMQHPKWEQSLSPGVVRRLKLYGKSKTLHFLESAGVNVKELYAPGPAPCRGVPDPILIKSVVETHRNAREFRRTRGMGDQLYWLGMVGGITDRKNLPLLLDAILALPQAERSSIGLALLGQFRCSQLKLDEVREGCLEAGVPLVVDDRLMTNEEVNISVAALDCVATLYSTHTPNSTVAKAVALGTAVLAAGSRSYRYHAELVTGVSTFSLSPSGIGNGLLQALAGGLVSRRQLTIGPRLFVERMLD